MKKVYIRNFIVSVCSIAAIAAGIFIYVERVQDQMWDQSVNFVMDTTWQGEKAFANRINSGQSQLVLLADMMKIYTRDKWEEAQEKLKERSQSEGGAYFSFLADETKEQDPVDQVVVDQVSENTEEDSGVVAPHLNTVTGVKVFDIFLKEQFKDGTGFYVALEYEVGKVSEEFTLNFYNGKGFSYIVDEEGNILIRSSHPNSNKTVQNFFDVLKKEADEADVGEFEEALRSGESGWARLSYRGEENLFCFAPVNAGNGWSIVSVIPVKVIDEQGRNIINRTFVLLGLVTAGILLIIGIFMLAARKSDKIIREREYRDFLFDLLSTSIDNVFLIYDPEKRKVDYVFENVERLFGVKRKDVMKDIGVIAALLDKEMVRGCMRRVTEGTLRENMQHVECPYHRVDSAEKMTAEMDIYATNDARFGRKYILCLQDQTEKIRMQQLIRDSFDEAKHASKAKSEFLNNMSHDIRTPINAIVGMTSIAEAHLDDREKVKDCLGKITMASDHLCCLINDVLDMSRIESGKVQLNEEDFDPTVLVQSIYDMTQNDMEIRGLRFEMFCGEIVHRNLTGDTLRLNQIFLNLLSNAMKFTKAGGTIHFAVEEERDEREDMASMVFTVSDTGIGMSADFLKHIFEPFEREAVSEVNHIQGTGLGLTITRNLVEMMGGKIEVASRQGEGTQFLLRIPFRIAENGGEMCPGSPGPDMAVQAKAEDFDYSAYRLLLVEDNDLNMEIASEIIGTLGIQIEQAWDGGEAVRLVAGSTEGYYDMVITDVKMPVMDGYEAARAIRSLHRADVAELPVIAMTANAFEEDRERAREAGMNGYLSKPIEPDRLLGIIQKFLRQKDRKG